MAQSFRKFRIQLIYHTFRITFSTDQNSSYIVNSFLAYCLFSLEDSLETISIEIEKVSHSLPGTARAMLMSGYHLCHTSTTVTVKSVTS